MHEWSSRVIELSALQLIPLHAILEYHDDASDCRGSEQATNEFLRCMDDGRPFELMARWPLLEEICPAGLGPADRIGCFKAVYSELSSRAFMAATNAPHYRLKISPLGTEFHFAWLARSGSPFASGRQARDYDEIGREIAQIDGLILFVDYFRLKSLHESARLRTQTCLVFPLYGVSQITCELDTITQEITLVQQDAAFELLVGNHDTLCSSELCQYLLSARADRVPVRLPAVSVSSYGPPEPPQTPGMTDPLPAQSIPPTVAPVRLGDESGVAGIAKARGQRLWVSGGRPIYLPKSVPPTTNDPANGGQQTARPTSKDLVIGLGTVDVELPVGMASAASGVNGSQSQPRDRLALRPTPKMFDQLDWIENISETIDEVRGIESATTRYLRRLSIAQDVANLGIALAVDDKVRKNASAVKIVAGLVGGPAALLAIELTGFGDALVDWEAHGGDVDQLMSWGAETAQSMLSPFSVGQPLPYSQMYVGAGKAEPASAAEISNYEKRLEQSKDDARYKPSCQRGLLTLGTRCIRCQAT